VAVFSKRTFFFVVTDQIARPSRTGVSSNGFQAALLIYDLGILGNDRDLSNAVWRRFFLTEEPDFEKIALLVRDRFYKTPISPENFSGKFSSSNCGQIYTRKTTELSLSGC
jgi:hypothetical protein